MAKMEKRQQYFKVLQQKQQQTGFKGIWDKTGGAKGAKGAKANDDHKILNKLMKITEMELKNKASNNNTDNSPRKCKHNVDKEGEAAA